MLLFRCGGGLPPGSFQAFCELEGVPSYAMVRCLCWSLGIGRRGPYATAVPGFVAFSYAPPLGVVQKQGREDLL